MLEKNRFSTKLSKNFYFCSNLCVNILCFLYLFMFTSSSKFSISCLFRQRYNHVPKFGNWETEEHVPYSLYFDEARKRRNAAKINPNDTHENQNTISDNLASIKTSTFQTEAKSGAQNGREDGDLRRPTESPWYHHTVNIEVAINSLVHRPGRKMTTRQQNAGFDSRIGRSPISPWRNYSTGRSQLRSVTQGAKTVIFFTSPWFLFDKCVAELAWTLITITYIVYTGLLEHVHLDGELDQQLDLKSLTYCLVIGKHVVGILAAAFCFCSFLFLIHISLVQLVLRICWIS